MHPRLTKLPQAAADYRRFLQVLRRERPDRIPALELAIHPEVVNALLDEPATQDPREIVQRNVRLHQRVGCDVVKVSAPIPWEVQRLSSDGTPAINWTDEHAGPIGNLRDFEQFRWPGASDVDFSPLDAAREVLPDGMRMIGFSGGVLEFAMDLIGMQRFLIATRRQPDLVAAVIERVGQTIEQVFATYCQMEDVCAIWLGDDLGHKHGTLLAPKWIAENLAPWYRRFSELAHRHDRPFLLHTCGNTTDVMPALVDTGIDAKHSFEDGIEPIESFYDRWHDRIAVLGGVDVHILATADDASIKRRTISILEHCAARGGYACGSGNSIPNYVPPENYLAMLEALAAFNAG